MLAKQVQIRKIDKTDWSEEGVCFINKLIQRKPENRLGFGGIEEIKNHDWLKDVNWKKLQKKDLEAPFIPYMNKNDFDQDPQITVEDEE